MGPESELIESLSTCGRPFPFAQRRCDHLPQLRRGLGLLVDGGASVIVIEHNLDIVAHADWVVDLGPGAGGDGGRIVYEGPPAKMPKTGKSMTGRFLHASRS
ncbi:hypothetical protein [Streptomyces sp. NPDC054995]